MKETVYRAKHEALGAKMEEFAGFYMPIQYDSITNEHLQVRNKVGVFDVSHMGEFTVKGPKALALLQHITTNDVAALFPARCSTAASRTAKAASWMTCWSITSMTRIICWW